MSNLKQYWVGCFRQLAYSILFLIYKIMETEIWKDIVWYEWLYQVSNLGRVKSLIKYNWTNKRILKVWIDKIWYAIVTLCKNKIHKTKTIHRLVWLTFLDNILWKKQINHKNWIKTDNRIKNLEWCNPSENQLHRIYFLNKKNNTFKIAEQKRKEVLQFDKNLNLLNKYISAHSASNITWINRWNICSCCRWIKNNAWWFIWKYL